MEWGIVDRESGNGRFHPCENIWLDDRYLIDYLKSIARKISHFKLPLNLLENQY
jgi:hypothetical protein